jgi:hypothetical protein
VRGPSMLLLSLSRARAKPNTAAAAAPTAHLSLRGEPGGGVSASPLCTGTALLPPPPTEGEGWGEGALYALAPIRRRVPSPHVFLLWWGTPFSYAKRGSPPGPPSSKTVCAFVGRGCRPLVLGASSLAMSRPLRGGAAPAVRQGAEAAGGLLPFPLTGRGVGARDCRVPRWRSLFAMTRRSGQVGRWLAAGRRCRWLAWARRRRVSNPAPHGESPPAPSPHRGGGLGRGGLARLLFRLGRASVARGRLRPGGAQD